MPARRCCWLLLAGLVLSGCRRGTPTGPPEKPGIRGGIARTVPAAGRLEQMTELSEFAKLYLLTTPSPRKLEDMPELERQHSRLYRAIAAVDYVVVWGADPGRAPQGASSTVLAYVKDAPEQGGAAAFLDGTAREVTATELKQGLPAQPSR